MSTRLSDRQIYSAIVHKLVDTLVSHYPVIVLTGRTERTAREYTGRAVRLTNAVSRILAIAPTYKQSDGDTTSSFMGSENSKPSPRFDKAFIQQHVMLCGDLLYRLPSDLLYQEASAYVRAALRPIVTAMGNREHRPDDDSLIWRAKFGWDDTKIQPWVFDCLVGYLKHLHKEEDFVGMGDALLVTGDIWRLGNGAQQAAFLDILTFSLGSKSVRLRHIAIRVAHDNIRVVMLNTTTTMKIGEKLLIIFLQALLTAASPDISPATKVVSHLSHTTENPSDVKSNEGESEPRIHRDRDQHYLQIIFTLANSPDWVPSIVKYGHLDRCLMLFKETSPNYLHIAVVLLQIEASKEVDSTPLNAITPERWGSLTTEAWLQLDSHNDDLGICLEALPALAERTIGYLSSNHRYAWLRKHVATIHEELKRQDAREIETAVHQLLLKIDSLD